MRWLRAVAWCVAGLILPEVAGCAGPLGCVVSRAPNSDEESPPTIKDSKVPTADEAYLIASSYKFAHARGVSDQQNFMVASLFRQEKDAPDFARSGDWIWVVQDREMWIVTQELWVNSRTGAVLVKPKPGEGSR
jgi:hypothetical protein